MIEGRLQGLGKTQVLGGRKAYTILRICFKKITHKCLVFLNFTKLCDLMNTFLGTCVREGASPFGKGSPDQQH